MTAQDIWVLVVRDGGYDLECVWGEWRQCKTLVANTCGESWQGSHCLQETEHMHNVDYHGWSLYGSQGVKAAVLLPAEIAGFVVWTSCFDNEFKELKRSVGVSLGQVGIVSAYLEHGNYKIDDFVATVCEIEKQLEKLKELGCRN